MATNRRQERSAGIGLVGVLVLVAALVLAGGLLAKIHDDLAGSRGPGRGDREVRRTTAVLIRPIRYPDGVVGAARGVIESFRELSGTPGSTGGK